jgi:hypothetical protein
MSRHLALLAASFFLCGTTDARAKIKLRFSGFGDFVAGYTGGDYADPQARGMFEAFGDDTDPVNTNRGFGVTGTDFVVIADMTEDLYYRLAVFPIRIPPCGSGSRTFPRSLVTSRDGSGHSWAVRSSSLPLP